MKIGKLYQIKQYFWYLFPSKETFAAHRRPPPPARHDISAAIAAYWSERLKCNISYISENNIFCLLVQDGDYLKVLSSNGEIGWMFYPKNEAWTKGCFEEVIE